MSKRTIIRDPSEARENCYKKLESTGEAQEALWEALGSLSKQGFKLGIKAEAILVKRAQIKRNCPK